MKKIIFAVLLVFIVIGIGIFALHKIAIQTPATNPTSELNLGNTLNNLPSMLSGESVIPLHHEKQYGYFGSLTITGYAFVVTAPVCVPSEKTPCTEKERPNYVFFTMPRPDNGALGAFLRDYQDTPFVAKQAIGLGCYSHDEERLYSENPGDNGTYQNELTGESLKRLLASDGKNQIQLTLTRPIYTSPEKPRLCYSYFRDFKITPLPPKPNTITTSLTDLVASSTEPTQ